MTLGFDLSSDDPVTVGVRASARQLLNVAAFSGVVNLLTLSGSIYMLQVYDRVIPSRNVTTLVGLSLIVLLAYVLQGYFDALRTRMLARIGMLFDAGLQKPIYLALATLPLRGVRPLVAQQPLRDLDQVRTFLSGIGPTAFLDMPWIPIFLIALYVFHPAIGAAATLGAASIIAITLATERHARAPTRATMETSAHRQVLADATRQNADVIRALGMTGRFTERWLRGNDRFLEISIRSMDTHANLGSGAKVLRYVLQSSMLGIGAYLVVIEQASGGIMIASSIMMGRALAPIEVALSTWRQLVAARQGILRLREIIKASGKSSLARALVGIWPAAHGKVRLDGAALDQWNCSDLGQHLGYLPQDVALFDGTVAENIARLDASASSRSIIEAAHIAGAHEMILRFPNGYETQIGEGGASLSSGQRQRIGLARAVFGDPFLVVLDEPDANLDVDGEKALTRTILTLRAARKIPIVISHRANVLAALNMALVIYAGRMVAFGPRDHVFEQLARSAGHQVPAASSPESPAAAARKDDRLLHGASHHATA